MTPSDVLVIDDCPDVHLLLEARLKRENVTLHHAYEAHTGLTLAAALQPDLILLDVDLPLMTGLELLQQLKLDPATATLP